MWIRYTLSQATLNLLTFAVVWKTVMDSFPDHTACPVCLLNLRLVLEWDQEETRVNNMNQMKSMGMQPVLCNRNGVDSGKMDRFSALFQLH